MKVDAETLRRMLDEEASSKPRAARGCPDPDLAARLLGNEAGAKEREAFAVHLLDCPDCAAEYRLAGPLEEFAKEAAPAPGMREIPTPARRAPAPRLAWALAAAIAAAAIGLSTAWYLSRGGKHEEAPVERGSAAATSAVVPPDGSTLTEPPEKLAWEQVEGAESYRVVLYDAESTPVWEASSAREPEVLLSDAVRERLRRGGSFYWKVEAVRRAERSFSDLHRFSVFSPRR